MLSELGSCYRLVQCSYVYKLIRCVVYREMVGLEMVFRQKLQRGNWSFAIVQFGTREAWDNFAQETRVFPQRCLNAGAKSHSLFQHKNNACSVSFIISEIVWWENFVDAFECRTGGSQSRLIGWSHVTGAHAANPTWTVSRYSLCVLI